MSPKLFDYAKEKEKDYLHIYVIAAFIGLLIFGILLGGISLIILIIKILIQKWYIALGVFFLIFILKKMFKKKKKSKEE